MPMAQPDIHPDADPLNAFVERALSPPERARIVAHMADCARCREVVYLAQAAAEPEPVPAAIAMPEPQSGWWSAAFARWRPALVPAAALAAVGGIVLWVQLHPASRPIETAQLASPRQPVAPPPAAVGERPPGVTSPAALTPAPRPDQKARSRANQQEKKPSSGPESLAMLRSRDRDAHNEALPGPSGSSTPEGEVHLDGRSAVMAQYIPPQPVSASPALTYTPQQRPRMKGSPGLAAQAPMSLAVPSPVNPPPAPPGPGVLAVHGDRTAQLAAQSLQQVEVSPQPFNELPVLRLTRPAKLPSGLDTVSSAALLNRLVAIDSAGAVFLSNDGGVQWEPVFAPWVGKAIEVQAPAPHGRFMPAAEPRRRQITAATEQAAINAAVESESKEIVSPPPPPPGASTMPASAPASAAKVKAAAPAPAMLFRLVTDHHQVWVSPDGKIWREQ